MLNRDPNVSRRWVLDAILWALLAALGLGVLTFDRDDWPSLIGDEATYLMAAESLAWDGDWVYDRQDYDRFVEHWQVPPYGLILQSGDQGEHLTFGKPFFYPLWIAPFVRLWPTGGAFLANFVLLAAAALLVQRTLRSTVGALAPVWVACFVFASVAFGYTFWAHADLFLLALVAIAYGLAFDDRQSSRRPSRAGWRTSLLWAGIGALLAIVVFSRPLYLPLLLPPFFLLPPGRRRRSAAVLVIGVLSLTVAAVAVHKLTADAWTSYGAQRSGFTESTGFPGVDFPIEQWETTLEQHGDAAWVEARSLLNLPPTALSLWWWNGVYFLIGRHIGVLPYFLPLLLGLLGRPRGVARWMLLLAVVVSVSGFFLYRPFNIYGGGGAIANRYFMPLYPAFWFLATRPCRGRRLVAVAVLAAPFLWPLWAAPRSFPQRQNHTYRYVSPIAQRILPYETTQNHLKPSGREDVVFRNLWIKFLSPSLRPKKDGSGLLLDRGARGELLVGSYRPIERLDLQIREAPAERVQVTRGARVLRQEPNDLGTLLVLEPEDPRARHPMWWTWGTFYLYELGLESLSEADGRLTFTLQARTVARGGAGA